jgi:glycerol uptake facilitator-like aquaporin
MTSRISAEALGTALLLAIVVGSGIMGERLAEGNGAVALLANSVATGAGLFTLISVFAPVSGAHFNPAVTIVAALDRTLSVPTALGYVGAQLAGAYAGVLAAHGMFGLPLAQVSGRLRPTAGECLGEVIATFGLLLTVRLLARAPVAQTAGSVALWIVAAYWFTSSTSFANPAVTIARTMSDSFAGIKPSSAPMFIVMQIVGALLAFVLIRYLYAQQGDR